jgi:P27 family predicted phage terminase small subunit
MTVRPVPAPPDFTPELRHLWHRVQRPLRRQATWADTDADVLESYCRAVEVAQRARAEDRRRAAHGRTVRADNSSRIPRTKAAREAASDARAYAAALLLTPASRRRAGIDAAKASPESELAAILA